MRRLLIFLINARKMIRTVCLTVPPLQFKNSTSLLCTSSFQGDNICNGTHGQNALKSDAHLFEAQFDELVADLTERDLADPSLADALTRLREVCCLVSSSHVICFFWPPKVNRSSLFFAPLHRFWCSMPLEARGTEACL